MARVLCTNQNPSESVQTIMTNDISRDEMNLVLIGSIIIQVTVTQSEINCLNEQI